MNVKLAILTEMSPDFFLSIMARNGGNGLFKASCWILVNLDIAGLNLFKLVGSC